MSSPSGIAMSAAIPTIIPVPMKDCTMPPCSGCSWLAGSFVKKLTESALMPRART